MENAPELKRQLFPHAHTHTPALCLHSQQRIRMAEENDALTCRIGNYEFHLESFLKNLALLAREDEDGSEVRLEKKVNRGGNYVNVLFQTTAMAATCKIEVRGGVGSGFLCAWRGTKFVRVCFSRTSPV